MAAGVRALGAEIRLPAGVSVLEAIETGLIR